MRGAQRRTWMKDILEWTKMNYNDCIRSAMDRRRWRHVVANLKMRRHPDDELVRQGSLGGGNIVIGHSFFSRKSCCALSKSDLPLHGSSAQIVECVSILQHFFGRVSTDLCDDEHHEVTDRAQAFNKYRM